jgi:hypothetical protein
MIDVLLAVIVLGTVTTALAVALAAAVEWIHGQLTNRRSA